MNKVTVVIPNYNGIQYIAGCLDSILSGSMVPEIIVVDSIKLDAIKTKDFRNFLGAIKAEGKSLVVTPDVDSVVVKSARNIPGVETTFAKVLNVYDILKAKNLVIDKNALAVIEEVFA